jgi:bis(5'-adenosyl)-triphosphatase
MALQKMVPSCPFCDSAIQSSVFYSHGNYLALYNIAPVLPGHTLVIPRSHFTSILEFSEPELHDFFIAARNTLSILMQAFHTDAFDWSIQEKAEAGQTIEHLHLHIVPRLKGDLPNPGDWYPLIQQNDAGIIDSMDRARLNSEHMKQIVDELRMLAEMLYPR